MLTIQIGAHPWFRREGLDLLCDIPVTIVEATLGASVRVPLLHGVADVQIPPGTSSGRKLRVTGQGIKTTDGSVGDVLAVIQIIPPESLSETGRSLLEQLASELPNPRTSAPWDEL